MISYLMVGGAVTLFLLFIGKVSRSNYRVVVGGEIVLRGSYQQCMKYVAKVTEKNPTTRGITIEPDEDQKF